MLEVLVWLLISLPGDPANMFSSPKHVHVVERFASAQECERVAGVLRDSRNQGGWTLSLRCVQARVVTPVTK